MTAPTLPPLPAINPHDHPEPRTYTWTRQEIAWIQRYATSYALAALTQPMPAAVAWHIRMRGCDGSADWVDLGPTPGAVPPEADALPLVYAQPVPDARPCTCHPDDNPPQPCAKRYALSECRAAAHPQPVPLTPRELELIDGMIQVQLHHAAQCDGMLAREGANHHMAEKQKGWDMERVALLRKLAGIVPAPTTRTYTRAELLDAIAAERHACSIAVWMTLQDALDPDADDKGLEGWMREAEQRVKNRLAHHGTEAPLPQPAPAGWREAVQKLVTGFEHVSGIARQWEPDHSSGADRAKWARATEACADVVKLLAAAPAAPGGAE